MKVHTSQAVILTERLLAFILFIHQPVLTSSSALNTDNSDRDNLLKHLFDGYDKRFIPFYITGNATTVGVQIYIYTIDSISEASMDYKMNMVLRSRWNDERLTYNSSADVDRLELDVNMMDEVWVPDIYIVSEKKAEFHNVIVPNKLMHIYPNGDVQYSLRVTGTFTCHMQLLAFPFDKQYCKFELESFDFSAKLILLRWNKSAVVTSEGLKIPQYDLRQVTPFTCDRAYYGIMYSCIGICFTFVRNYGYYMTQVYIPSMLVVILSWVNFWIDQKSVPARISVGLLTVLTMTTQFSGARASLPRVSYTTAIDIWMACCLIFVFLAFLEFALVNVLSRAKRKEDEKNYTGSEEETKFHGNTSSNEGNSTEQLQVRVSDTQKEETGTNCTKLPCFQTLANKTLSRAAKVDLLSRYVFPTLFAIFNFVYWIYYLAVFEPAGSSCAS